MGSQRRSVCKNFQAAGNGSSVELRGDWNAPWMNKHGVLKCQAAHFWVCVCVCVFLRTGVFGVTLKH